MSGLILVVGAAIVILGLALPTNSTRHSSTSSTTTTTTPNVVRQVEIPVVACPTRSQGPTIPAAATPGTTAVVSLWSSEVGHVALYQGAGVRIVAPRRWQCAASIYFDDSTLVAISPPRSAAPGFFPEPSSNYSTSPRVQFSGVLTCYLCKLIQSCAFFPRAKNALVAAHAATTTCRVPLGESVTLLGPTTATIDDPPGVTGHGAPSGGPYPAASLAYFGLAPRTLTGSYLLTCTLPSTFQKVCATSLRQFSLDTPRYLHQVATRPQKRILEKG